MIGEKQKQEVGDGATAILSGGDTIINNGLSYNDVRDIIEESKQQQIKDFFSIAEDVASKRCDELNLKISEKITSEQINRESFKEPSFQYLIGQAQTAYAKSGDENVADILAGLITERSKQNHQSIEALSIAQAIEIAPKLTKKHIDQLTYIFFLKHTLYNNIKTIRELGNNYKNIADKFFNSISTTDANYQYLSSLGCIEISPLEADMYAILKRYDVFNIGTSVSDASHDPAFIEYLDKHEVADPEVIEEIEALISAGLLIPSQVKSNTYFPFCGNKQEFINACKANGLHLKNTHSIFYAMGKHIATFEQIKNCIEPEWPNFKQHVEIWKATPVKNCQLLSTGIAIAHSNLTNNNLINADIGIWIND